MGNKMYEGMKVDVGLKPTSIATGNLTGAYHSLADYRKVIAVLEVAAMAAAETAKIEVFQAKDAAAGSAKLLTGATATITGNTLVTSMTLTLGTVLNTHAVVLNGTTYLAHTDTTVLATHQFSISGDDSADADALCLCINDATYGQAGVTAVNNAGVVTLTSTIPGAQLLTAVNTVGATIACATLSAQAYVELDSLTLEDDFTHIATKITTVGTIIAGAILLRGGQRVGISQKVGASASV